MLKGVIQAEEHISLTATSKMCSATHAPLSLRSRECYFVFGAEGCQQKLTHELVRGSEGRHLVNESNNGGWTLNENMIKRCSQAGQVKQVTEQREITIFMQSTAEKY